MENAHISETFQVLLICFYSLSCAISLYYYRYLPQKCKKAHNFFFFFYISYSFWNLHAKGVTWSWLGGSL